MIKRDRASNTARRQTARPYRWFREKEKENFRTKKKKILRKNCENRGRGKCGTEKKGGNPGHYLEEGERKKKKKKQVEKGGKDRGPAPKGKGLTGKKNQIKGI